MIGATSKTLSKLIPLVIHVDGAWVYSNGEFFIWSWSSILASGSVMDFKLYLGSVPCWMMKKPETKRRVITMFCNFIAWCLKVLRSGRFPEEGFPEFGEPLSGFLLKHKGMLIAGGKWLGTFAGYK